MSSVESAILGSAICAEDARLLSTLPEEAREGNGIPDRPTAKARERAASLAEAALADILQPDGVRVSPLGAAWSRDIDLYVTQEPSRHRLERLGWLPLDELLLRIGSPGSGRWMVVEGHDVLSAAHIQVGPPPDPLAAVLSRCRDQGRVRVREVLELRALVRAGRRPPAGDAVVALAARGEAALGGTLLSGFATGRPILPPVRVPGGEARRASSRMRRFFRPRVGVAISGVDGAGKSTMSTLLAERLARATVPVTQIWTRPGMRLRLLGGLARTAKRALRHDPAPGVRRVASGDDVSSIASRRGAAGWLWSLLVTIAFLADVRKRHTLGRGVLIYDRHVLDALATLRFAYPGIDISLHERLVRRVLPEALVTVYLSVPPDVAVERKPGDVFGQHAVASQLEVYASRLREAPRVHVLDARRAPTALAHETLALVTREVRRRDRAVSE